MSKLRFDPIIHPPNRLKICAFLMPLEEAEFQVLREELGVSDSVLSKQISQLADAGYVRLRKAAVHGRQRTWAQLTARGRKGFAAHVEALQELAAVTSGSGV